MNFADIQNAWQSPHNRPPAAELEKQKMEFIQTLHRRDRGFVIGLTLIIAGLVLMTVMLLRNQMVAGGTPAGIDFSQEWSVWLFFALPWIGTAWVFFRYRRMLARQGDYSASIVDSVRALAEQNRFAQAKTRLILALEIVALPIVALVLQQLLSVGKMRPHEAKSGALLFGLAMLLAIGGMLWELFKKLRPEQQRLEALLRSYDAELREK